MRLCVSHANPVVYHHHAASRVSFGHVTADAAGQGRDLARGPLGPLVARQADGLVRRQISRRPGVGVVTGRARKSALALEGWHSAQLADPTYD